MTINEAHARVTRGAALLDRVAPGWHWWINSQRLLMESCFNCALGQLYGHFDKGQERLGFQVHIDSCGIYYYPPTSDAVTHGFVLSMEDLRREHANENQYDLLRVAWVNAIEDRRDGVFPPVTVEQETVGV